MSCKQRLLGASILQFPNKQLSWVLHEEDLALLQHKEVLNVASISNGYAGQKSGYCAQRLTQTTAGLVTL